MFIKKSLPTAAIISLLILSGCSSPSDNESSSEQSAAFANMPALAIEDIGVVETLKGQYDGNWIFAHDLNFNTLGRGKIMVIDAAAEKRHYRGQIDADQFATFTQSAKRNELYVAETFYSRGSRGKRTDVVSIYDQDSLKNIGEILLPNNNRGMMVTQKNAFRLTNDQKFALVFTFTPSSGVAVIDLDNRIVANEIDIPGCSLIYPKGDRGFATLCGDGTLVAFELDANGKVTSSSESKAFNDIDSDAMFMKAGVVGENYYFPTYTGQLQAVTLGSGEPVVADKWNFASDSGWGPSGWQVISADAQGLIYVLMREAVKEGDHKFGGSQVWVLNPTEQKIVRKIDLDGGGFSIEVTRAEKPLLFVTNASMTFDVYDLSNDKLLRNIGGFHSSEAFVLHAAEMP